jgi:hypothetical protein
MNYSSNGIDLPFESNFIDAELCESTWWIDLLRWKLINSSSRLFILKVHLDEIKGVEPELDSGG